MDHDRSLPPVCAVEPAPTIVDILRIHVAENGDQIVYRFLVTGEVDGPRVEWTYADVDRRARAVAAELQAAGLAGKPVLLLFAPGLDFIAAFFGALYAGAIAVPAY